MSEDIYVERRESTISDADVEKIRLACFGNLTPFEHSEQHNIFRDYIYKEQLKAERRAKLKTQAFGAIVVGIAGGIPAALYWCGTYFRDHWK